MIDYWELEDLLVSALLQRLRCLEMSLLSTFNVLHLTSLPPPPPRQDSYPGVLITERLYMTGNPVPEAKWVLRGRIVTNNTSPLYGNNENIQYVITEKGQSLLSPVHSLDDQLNTHLHCRRLWEMVQPDCGQHLRGGRWWLHLCWCQRWRSIRAKRLPHFWSTKGKWLN